MKTIQLLAAACGLLIATAAAADDHSQTRGSMSTQSKSDSGMMEDGREPPLGHKTWKERINTVARKPLRHDIQWLDSRDRTEWRDHEVWHGIRDERPLIARKTTGFHEPRPNKTRRERVLTISRGPIQGPGFAE